jgi:hypothetical protein
MMVLPSSTEKPISPADRRSKSLSIANSERWADPNSPALQYYFRLWWTLSRQMSIGYFRAQNLPRAATIHEQKQWSSTVSRRANRQYRI